MADTCYLRCIIILLCIRSTKGTPLGGAEKLQNGGNFKEAQVAASTLEQGKLSKKTLLALRGEEVTLVVDTIGESKVKDIQWVKNGINFATTQPSESVTIRDSSYHGRLGSSNDGSLIIYKFEMEDQGEYKADILMTDLKKYEIIYDLSISEGGLKGNNLVAVVVSVIVVLLVVVAAGVGFMLWRKKKMMPFANNREHPTELRSDPEGKGESEKEKLKESSPNPHEGNSEQKEETSLLKEHSPNNHDDETNEKFEDAMEFQ